MMPISLSDASMTMLLQLASPLNIEDRGRFLEAVATRLSAEPEIGDGIVARVAVDEQKRLLVPPADWSSTPPRWSRPGRPRKNAGRTGDAPRDATTGRYL